MSVSPSSIARTLAGALWPEVQRQSILTKGIYEFSCAGHGGVIAVLDHAPSLEQRLVRVARETNRTELVVVAHGQRLTTIRYTRPSLEDYARLHGLVSFECWVGEEDCEWSTIMLASEAARPGFGRRYVTQRSAEEVHTFALGCAQRWCDDFLTGAGLPLGRAGQYADDALKSRNAVSPQPASTAEQPTHAVTRNSLAGRAEATRDNRRETQ